MKKTKDVDELKEDLRDGLLYLHNNFDKIKSKKHSFVEMTSIRGKVIAVCNNCNAFTQEKT